MAKHNVPDAELANYRRHTKPLPRSDLAAPTQFMRDFEAIAFALTDPDWHKPPKPNCTAMFPPFRTYEVTRRLPIAPLLRMARLVGPESLRYLAGVGSDKGASPYRIHLRGRLDKEFKRGNLHKAYDRTSKLIEFGNRVLEIEQVGGNRRGNALAQAADELAVAASSRSYERYFQQFRELCHRLGYVPHPSESLGFPPQFALIDLELRETDTAQK